MLTCGRIVILVIVVSVLKINRQGNFMIVRAFNWWTTLVGTFGVSRNFVDIVQTIEQVEYIFVGISIQRIRLLGITMILCPITSSCINSLCYYSILFSFMLLRNFRYHMTL